MKPRHNDSIRTDAAKSAAPGQGGFTLVEINLVLLLVGIGLVALLGLFPVGLRQAGLATGDTVQALFADRVLNTLQARASEITDWAKWVNFNNEVLDGVSIDGKKIVAYEDRKIDDYLGTGSAIRYRLEFHEVAAPDSLKAYGFGGRLRRATIRVSEREASILTNAPVYCTDFVFMGSPPL